MDSAPRTVTAEVSSYDRMIASRHQLQTTALDSWDEAMANDYWNHRRDWLRTLSDDLVLDDHYETKTIYDEIAAQAGSETSLYGDAWAGASIEIELLRLALSASKAVLKGRGLIIDEPAKAASVPIEIPF